MGKQSNTRTHKTERGGQRALCLDCGQPDPMAELVQEMQDETDALLEDMRRESEALFEELQRENEQALGTFAETRWCGTCGREIESTTAAQNRKTRAKP
jgi:hypothetical protein